jgi:citronellol/citronellal dehydrogenase
MDLGGKTLFITGASRGIGLAVALRAARDGAKIAIAAKTAEPHKHLPGTIHTAAEEIRAAGGQALPLVVDVRDEASIQAGVQRTVEAFGGIDICVNNASAVSLSKIEDTDARRFDLMQQVNARGTFVVSRACQPHLRRAANPHILNMAPPLNLDPKWFAGHVAYTISKYGMSMCTLGMAAELAAEGIAVNALWPRIGVATAAIEFAFADASELARCRKPEIMADAAHAVLTRPSRERTGQFLIDDEVLYEAGVRDFSVYRNDPDATPRLGMFLPDDATPPPGVDMTGATRPVRG